MKTILTYVFISLISILFTTISYCQQVTTTYTVSTGDNGKLTDAKMLALLDIALKTLPEKIKTVPNNIRRVSFYSLKADRTQVSQALLRQIQGKIEAAFSSGPSSVTLVYSPEIKPVRIVAKDDTLTFTSGFQTTEEIKAIAQRLRLDGLLEGEIYYTSKDVFLNLRIFDTETMAIVWSCELTSVSSPPPPPVKEKMFWYDLGIGGCMIPVEPISVEKTADTASFYDVDLRILSKTLFEEKLKFTMSAGVLFLYEGIKSSTRTIVSSSKCGTGPSNFFARIGVRISLIQKESVIASIGKRDLLATEFSVGNIFATSSEAINIPMYSLRFESDITREIRISVGLTYVSPTKIPDVGVKTGGFAYEISIIRFILNP